MNFMSLASGIEAASVAFEPLGWKAVSLSEIDPFACAVLAHHYPEVPNFGDMTRFMEWPEEAFAAADIVVGGPPCQAFSVAGMRAGLNDARGNLTLTYAELIDHADDVRARRGRPPVVALYENVPGILSDKTNAFGCLLAALAGEDEPIVVKKWPRAGVVDGGRRRVAWVTLDAQYFGVAQRRRRVFVLAVPCELIERLGERADPARILSIGSCLRGNTPTRGEAREGIAAATLRSAGGGSDVDHARGGHLICMAHGQGGAEIGIDRGPTLTCNHEAPIVAQCVTGDITHTLKAEGFDASEDGTGRGQPIVTAFQSNESFSSGGNVDIAPTLRVASNGCGQPPAIAFSCKDYGADAGDISPTLRAMGHGDSHASAANRSNPQPGDPCHPLAAGAHPPAIAVSLRGRDGGATAELGDEVQNCLWASSGGGDKPHVLCSTSQGIAYAPATKTRSIEALRTLRRAVGEEAFAVWSLGILAALQPAEVLQSSLHGTGFRSASFSRSWMVHCALSRSKDGSGWLLQSLREAECEGCPPQGWEPSEQLARELGAYLSELSQPGAQASRFMRDLWEASEGAGLLRQALSALQEMGRPASGEYQSEHGTSQVRRLTVEECEFLQGFPRGYTRIPYRNKPASQCPAGPRYKALGNSWAVPVVSWIGERIQGALGASAFQEEAA